MGPTASGKTNLAIELTQKLPLEIISVDSGMIYRYMNIGTAKPTPQQQIIAPHHLINICEPTETYSAAQFRTDALQAIRHIHQQKKIPLLVGGTMLYFKILQSGISPLPIANQEIRQRLLHEAESYGWPAMHERLHKIDPLAAEKISINDGQRIQRALEVYEISGLPISTLCQQKPPTQLPYEIINLALMPQDREKHIADIARRCADMFAQGWIDEVKNLLTDNPTLYTDLPSMRTVGYRQILHHLQGKIAYQDLQNNVIIATRQLAKRQATWLRSWKEVNYFPTDTPKLASKVESFLQTKFDELG
jgi:tRNA dimethylallyltransferase